MPDFQQLLPSRLTQSAEWLERKNLFSIFSTIYGLILFVLSIISYLRIRKNTSISEQIKCFFVKTTLYIQSLIKNNASKSIYFMIAIVLGLFIRDFFLYQPLRYDEAFSYFNFARGSLIYVFNFPVPNNHILHSLLMKLSVFLFGNLEPGIRLPSMLAGIAAIPAVNLICRQLNLKGTLATLGTATFPLLIFYSTNARGYTLLILFSLWMIALGIHFLKSFNRTGLFIFSLIGALGMWTMLAMVVPLAGIYLWLGILFLIHGRTVQWILMKFVIPSALIMGALCFLFYTPVILTSNGILTIIANETVKSITWSEFTSQLSWHYLSIYTEYVRNIPVYFTILILCLFTMGLLYAILKRNWTLLLLFPVVAIGSSIPFYMKHSMLLTRTWLHLIPLMLITADAGYSFIHEKILVKLKIRTDIITSVIFLFYGISLVTHNSIARYPDTGRFAEAPVAANYLKNIIQPDDVIRTKEPANWPLRYYLWQDAHWEGEITTLPTDQADYFIFHTYYNDIQDFTDQPVKKVMDFKYMAIYIPDKMK